MDKIKVLFMGTPDFAVNILNSLIDNVDVVGVVTQPDKEVGRHKELRFPPVKEVAIKNSIKVYQPINIKNEYEELINIDYDMIVTCAYGQIIPKELLDYPKYGCINVHASLLPKLRGGAPIHKAIINGDKKTGITIMYMVEAMDAGDIISQCETEISDDDNLESLHDRLSVLGAKLLIDTLPNIVSGNINPIPQNKDEVTYAWNIKREEEKIDFNKNTRDIFNQIRGLSPVPGAYCLLDDEVFKIYKASIVDRKNNKDNGEILDIDKSFIYVGCTDGVLRLEEIQPAGKKRMKVVDYINGIDKNKLIGKVFK